MLGMMNCPTDNVEFYSASPSSRRSYLGDQAGEERKEQSQSDDETVRVFSEARDKPQISYTEDGRKLVDGKLLQGSDSAKSDPMKMWDRLILAKVAAGQLRTEDQPTKARRRGSDKGPCSMSIPSMTNPKIQPAIPIQVNSAKPAQKSPCSTKSLPGEIQITK